MAFFFQHDDWSCINATVKLSFCGIKNFLNISRLRWFHIDLNRYCTCCYKLALWMAGSGDGAGYFPVPGHPTTLAYGRAGAYCACRGCGTCGLFCLFSFLNASSLGRRLRILNYCGLGRYNTTVVVSY